MLSLFADQVSSVSYEVGFGWWASLVIVLVGYAIIEWYHTKHDHVVEFREAVRWTIFYIAIALLYAVPIFLLISHQAGAEYLAALGTEKALSLDNLFVIGLIFTQLRVPDKLQRRMLNYGVAGAIFFRLIFILGGLALLQRFEWIAILFGAILLHAAWTTFKEARSGEKEAGDALLNGRLWRFVTKVLPITHHFDGHKLVTRVNGRRFLTMMAAGIIMVEITDIIFAVDSVPAVLAITSDKFIAYSSNIFAILGLRALFFVYRAVEARFWALQWGLVCILTWIGLRLIAHPFHFEINTWLGLSVIFVFLFGSIGISLLFEDPATQRQTIK